MDTGLSSFVLPLLTRRLSKNTLPNSYPLLKLVSRSCQFSTSSRFLCVVATGFHVGLLKTSDTGSRSAVCCKSQSTWFLSVCQVLCRFPLILPICQFCAGFLAFVVSIGFLSVPKVPSNVFIAVSDFPQRLATVRLTVLVFSSKILECQKKSFVHCQHNVAVVVST